MRSEEQANEAVASARPPPPSEQAARLGADIDGGDAVAAAVVGMRGLQLLVRASGGAQGPQKRGAVM